MAGRASLSREQFDKLVPPYTKAEQLTLFEPLSKLRYDTTSEEVRDLKLSDPEALWQDKLEQSRNPTLHFDERSPDWIMEADAPPLYNRLERSQIHTPVLLMKHPKTGEDVLVEGHHRIAAAADIANRRGNISSVEVPVRWIGSVDESWDHLDEANEFKTKLSPREESNWDSGEPVR